jgi:WD40-like Beta Propeller Repeat
VPRGVEQEQPRDRPSLSTAASEASGPSGGDRSSLSGRIAFDNFDDVWSINADGTDLTRLTRSPEPEFHPTWSPDGTQIAFRFERNDDPEIWLMNADGSDRRRLTRGLSPAWSPDGSKDCVREPRGDTVSSRPGTPVHRALDHERRWLRQHRLPHTDGGEYPSWSPDGKRIIFNSNLSSGGSGCARSHGG